MVAVGRGSYRHGVAPADQGVFVIHDAGHVLQGRLTTSRSSSQERLGAFGDGALWASALGLWPFARHFQFPWGFKLGFLLPENDRAVRGHPAKFHRGREPGCKAGTWTALPDRTCGGSLGVGYGLRRRADAIMARICLEDRRIVSADAVPWK